MNEHLPDITVSFRERFREVAARQDAIAGATDPARDCLDARGESR
ncbi:MAG: hypothetical protein ACOH2F_00670 [Cellulomonas sp.]